MTGRRRSAAGRGRAWRCTGPLTVLGKQSAARNALRHGLNVPVAADPLLANEVVALADRVANGSAGPEVRAHAVRVAEVQTDVQRVRDARHPVMAALIAEPGKARELLRELVVLDRYEKRAVSRRKSAILAFGVTRLLRAVT